MRQLQPGVLPPPGLVRRLCAHYARVFDQELSLGWRDPLGGPAGALAGLYWTGAVDQSMASMLRARLEKRCPEHDARGRLDQHAVMAELRALIAYCESVAPRKHVADWLDPERRERVAEWDTVVPWAWQPPEDLSGLPTVGTRVLVDDQGTRGHLGVRLVDEPGVVSYVDDHTISIRLDRIIDGLEGWDNEFALTPEDGLGAFTDGEPFDARRALAVAFRDYTTPVPVTQ